MSSVQPLRLNYSFAANRRQATDLVDAAQLDAALATITNKLNEIVDAINVPLRPDNTLKDGSLEPRHFSDEVNVDIAGQINTAFLAQ
jgi:hypothetical protein